MDLNKEHTRLEIFVKPQSDAEWQFHHIPQPNERPQARRDAKRLLKSNPSVAIVEVAVSYKTLVEFSPQGVVADISRP